MIQRYREKGRDVSANQRQRWVSSEALFTERDMSLVIWKCHPEEKLQAAHACYDRCNDCKQVFVADEYAIVIFRSCAPQQGEVVPNAEKILPHAVPESITVVCRAHPHASPEPVVPAWSDSIILCLHNEIDCMTAAQEFAAKKCVEANPVRRESLARKEQHADLAITHRKLSARPAPRFSTAIVAGPSVLRAQVCLAQGFR